MTKEFKLSQEKQKTIAFAALRNYANFLRRNNNRKGLERIAIYAQRLFRLSALAG